MKKIMVGLFAASLMVGNMHAGPKFDKVLDRSSYASDRDYEKSLQILLFYLYVQVVSLDADITKQNDTNILLLNGGIDNIARRLVRLNPATQEGVLDELFKEEAAYRSASEKWKYWREMYKKVYLKIENFVDLMKQLKNDWAAVNGYLPKPDKIISGVGVREWIRNSRPSWLQ